MDALAGGYFQFLLAMKARVTDQKTIIIDIITCGAIPVFVNFFYRYIYITDVWQSSQ